MRPQDFVSGTVSVATEVKRAQTASMAACGDEMSEGTGVGVCVVMNSKCHSLVKKDWSYLCSSMISSEAIRLHKEPFCGNTLLHFNCDCAGPHFR